MKLFGPGTSASSLILALLLPACSGSGGGPSTSGTMFIETCSLGCSSGQGGNQVNCSIIQAFLNQEIAVIFSQSVAPSSVNSQTFQLIDEISGQVPVGTRFVDPSNPHKVIFRPAVSFDEAGTPSFGFTPNTTYRVTIPGTAQNDPGPFIKSVGGKLNKSRMQCDIQTSNQIVDPVPGSPSVEVFVDQAITSTPDLDDVIPNVPADGATDVWLQSKITFVFNDLMNPATLANPITHQPAFVTIKVDADGNLGTPEDQQPLFGEYLVDLDFDLLKTTMVFTSPIGIPSGGDPSLHPLPRKIVIQLPSGIQDLAFNPLANPGILSFTPEIIDLDPVTLPDSDGENFDSTANLDEDESGADWGDGRLTRGYGGGSGRLGRLRIGPGVTVTLNTDSQDFPLPSVQTGLPDILNNYAGELSESDLPLPPVTISDGQFEFSTITIDAGGTLKLVGSKPARLFSRGPSIVSGGAKIDVRGETRPQHASNNALGQTGAAGGPSGGAGGQGADRPDHGGSDLIPAGAIDQGGDGNPNTLGFSKDGRPGIGVGGTGDLGFGPGGAHYPDLFPISIVPNDLGGLQTTLDGLCITKQVGAPGGGGAYATSPAVSTPMSSHPTTWEGQPTTPSGTPGGDSTAVALEEPDPENEHFKRKLPFEFQLLRGGAGGGGGSANLFDTRTGGTTLPGVTPPCSDEVDPGQGIGGGATTPYRDHSGAGGGGGGGAVQLISGRTLNVSGQILATGGAGGSALLVDPGTTPLQRTMRASPGGGGSGGAIKLQALVLAIETTPGTAHIFIDGGLGGTNTLGAAGGKGGVGLVRLEDTTGSLTRPSESPKIEPFDPTHTNPVTGLVESEGWVSTATWERPRRRPESFSGAVSCWMRPTGSFFQLEFIEDDPTNLDPELRFGWNMDVIYKDDDDPAEVLIKYRGPDPNSPFTDDLETVIGNQLNHDLPTGQGSYFAVRFQGAIANGPLTNPCDVEFPGGVAPGSLTPWVKHPAELNNFSPRPNMVRFTVVFDYALATAHSVPSFIKGVDNLKIRTQPE